MPIYKYTCNDCGKMDPDGQLVKLDESDVEPCPYCESTNLTKQDVYAARAVFKGGCWSHDGYTDNNIDTPEDIPVHYNPKGYKTPQLDWSDGVPKAKDPA